MKKIISVILTVMLAASLCACAGTVKNKDTATTVETADRTDTEQTGAAPGGASKADYGWISFTMPDGFADAKETDQYVTVLESIVPDKSKL